MSRWWFVLIVALGAGAHAQPAPDPAAAAYIEARRLYDIKEWDQAIVKFKESYRLKPEARSLFNIAQAYRLKGDCVEAVSFYRTFKRNYPAEQTEKVDKFIVELEPCAKQQAANRPAVTPVTPVTPVPVTEPPKPDPKSDPKPDPNATVTTPPKPDPGVSVTPKPDVTQPEVKPREPVRQPVVAPPITQPPATEPEPVVETSSPGRGKRVAGLVIGGVGIAAVAAGVYFGLRAKSTASDVEGSESWDPGLDQQGKNAERNAIILWSAGGAAILGGGVLYFLGRRSAEPARLSIVPRASGATVVWSCEL
ncbi:MAG: hypothetical protein H0T89_27710 [Deltaproteobacteria bacterium]|nr:hypothetical protein [Deltaproteobacteria bacterium]MDQ3296674.1 hypothetical protein [Myxococcota bacterium]